MQEITVNKWTPSWRERKERTNARDTVNKWTPSCRERKERTNA